MFDADVRGNATFITAFFKNTRNNVWKRVLEETVKVNSKYIVQGARMYAMFARSQARWLRAETQLFIGKHHIPNKHYVYYTLPYYPELHKKYNLQVQ